MTSREAPVNPDEPAVAREIVARASAFGVNTKTAGSMNDSVKRHRDHAQAEADDWEPINYDDGSKTVMCERVGPTEPTSQLPVKPADQKACNATRCHGSPGLGKRNLCSPEGGSSEVVLQGVA